MSDHRNSREIVGRRRRTGGPFERRGTPGIVAGEFAAPQAENHIGYQDSKTCGKDYPAGARQEIEVIPAHISRISIDTARHAHQTEKMHRKECDIEADEGEPEI